MNICLQSFYFIILIRISYSISFRDDLSMRFSHTKPKIPVDITFKFTPLWNIESNEQLTINMPRFTMAESVTSRFPEPQKLVVSPSLKFLAFWHEGDYNKNIDPYNTSMITLVLREGQTVSKFEAIVLTIFAENGLRAYCGFPSDSSAISYTQIVPTIIASNVSTDRSGEMARDHMGSQCSLYSHCGTYGLCDYCTEKCHCNEGFGSSTDIIVKGGSISGNCMHRACPAGRAIADVPIGPQKAHEVVECSNAGICDRDTGECVCFPPFTGPSCNRMRCPNDCSGHGQCLSMREIAQLDYGVPLVSIKVAKKSVEYGYDEDIAWDADIVHGCVCDSSWSVGLGSTDTQLAEYFGADCSMKRCPSGDNPTTPRVETDCVGKQQTVGGIGYGVEGNKCHVDCSDRGTCDYATGVCSCFDGSYGSNCGLFSSPARRP